MIVNVSLITDKKSLVIKANELGLENVVVWEKMVVQCFLQIYDIYILEHKWLFSKLWYDWVYHPKTIQGVSAADLVAGIQTGQILSKLAHCCVVASAPLAAEIETLKIHDHTHAGKV